LSRIWTCVGRLSETNRAYDDLVKPVIGLLHCMALGARLVLYGADQKVANEGRRDSSAHKEYGVMKLPQWKWALDEKSKSMRPTHQNITLGQADIGVLRTPQLWAYLKQLRLQYIIGESQSCQKIKILNHVVETIDNLYMLWRQKLDEDQMEAEKQSRYYSYRGEDDVTEPSEKDIQEMFPKHDIDESKGEVDEEGLFPGHETIGHDSPNNQSDANFDARKSADELARYHRSLFVEHNPQVLLRSYLQECISVGDETHIGFGEDEMLSLEMMPSLFLSMESKLKALMPESGQSFLNIYADTDVSETRKIYDITRLTQTRFREIAGQWPEHAVPAEVLTFCDQVMALKMTDPIAKLLTKTEKLLEIVAQWQAVASKEWSVTNIVEALTVLIIHWRRLELGSWSRLLDEEDKKHQEDADAWYFVAYESVIYNSLAVVQNAAVGELGRDVSQYSQKLTTTLEEYLRNTTLGQYMSRLELLRAFAVTLGAIARKELDECATRRVKRNVTRITRSETGFSYKTQQVRDAMDQGDGDVNGVDDEADVDSNLPQDKRGQQIMILHEAVMNVIHHHNRYKVHVSKSLSEGRSALEKKITEQIKLASWKDTNITALRESARRSHFKLFKIVKKYRALLGQPVTSFAAAASPSTDLPGFSAMLASPKIAADINLGYVKFCAEHIAGWHDRPERLKNPLGAASTMRHAYTSKIPEFLPSSELKRYLENISSSVQELRKATPTTLTDDNTSIVRDLKQRKRRLLADTMKEIAQMGIRRNLGTADLSSQATTSVVLAGVPTFLIQNTVTQAADLTFHDLVDTLPPARQAALEHSEELTDGEIKRGLGYLEGFFNLAIKQRGKIGTFHRQLEQLGNVVSMLSASQNASNIQITTTDAESTFEQLTHQLTWLPNLMDVLAGVVEFQGKKGSLDVDDTVTLLRQYSADLRIQNEKLQALPNMPPGLQVRWRHEVEKESGFLLQSLQEDVRRFTTQHPQLEHIAVQIRKWLDHETNGQIETNGDSSTEVANTEKWSRDLLDKIFVALQQATEVLRSLPSSTEDKQWLAKTTECHARAHFALHLDALSAELETILHTLHTVAVEELRLALSVLATASPVIQQFQIIVQDLHSRMLHLHVQTCRVAVFLGKTFTTLASEGFCTPSQPSDGQEQTSKVEQGTGLGEGEAAEDISKDVDEDEDLTDLAQEGGQEEKGGDEIENSKDAVDMGADELEGNMGSGDEQVSGDEQESEDEGGEEQAVDEETGSVDDLDPNAVDEKMWDDMQKEAENEEKEMKSQKAQGQKSDDQAARQEGQDQEQDGDLEADEEVDEVADNQDESDAQQKPEGENLDPHLQEQQALDMPDDVQLNGEEEKEDEIPDTDMDGLSDVADDMQAEDKQNAELPDEDQVDREGAQDLEGDTNQEREEEVAGEAQDDEIIEDQPFDSEETKDEHHEMREEDMLADIHDQENGDSGVANTNQTDLDAQMDENAPQGQNDAETVAQEVRPQQGARSSKREQSGTDQGAVEQGIGRQEDTQDKQNEALKKLADVLEQYHRRREIFTANEDRQQEQADRDVDMADADFEHLNGDQDEAEAQALGNANQDFAQNLEQGQAIEDSRANAEDNLPMPEDTDKEMAEIEQETLAQKMTRFQEEHEEKDNPEGRSAVLPDSARDRSQKDIDTQPTELEDRDLDEITAEVEQLQNDLASSIQFPTSTSMADAQHLWSLTSNKTQTLSLMLTEQLRLILQPTTATKLRGDFRTGKRLNIRRIIPYIASGYKRDKIWMRRSVPSKRNYQVMLAVDDSKSMAESGADILALETLCMLSRSLSMLEVGELSIVAFGKDYNSPSSAGPPQAVKVAHSFSAPFSPSMSGPETFSNFTFNQTGTNIRALLSESISIFKDARIKSSAREAADLWQLQIIISDGHIGSDADDSVLRLVRKAREEKIMCVFVVVDNSEESIVDLEEVLFERDPADENGNGDGEMKMRKKRYLEGFPFQYYVVVREVRDLPGVLGRVLKGWFEGVVESG